MAAGTGVICPRIIHPTGTNSVLWWVSVNHNNPAHARAELVAAPTLSFYHLPDRCEFKLWFLSYDFMYLGWEVSASLPVSQSLTGFNQGFHVGLRVVAHCCGCWQACRQEAMCKGWGQWVRKQHCALRFWSVESFSHSLALLLGHG